MSLTVVRPVSLADIATPPVRALAQVNLLPPEIRARRSLKTLSRWLVAGLTVLAVAVAGGYVLAARQVAAAQEELTAVQSETARLTREQLTYAEVPTVLGQVSELRDARAQGFSTEIPWGPYLGAVFAVLPDDVQMTSMDVSGATPMLAAPVPVDPLQAPSLSRLTFTARSTSIPDTADWIGALNTVPGLADAWVSNATLGHDDAHGTYYEVTGSVQVTDAALTHRFDVMEGN